MDTAETNAIAHQAASLAAHLALESFAEERLQTAVDKAINSAVLKILGVDIEDKEEVRALRADMQHLRDWRQITTTVRKYGVIGFTGALVSLIGTLLYTGFLGFLTQHQVIK